MISILAAVFCFAVAGYSASTGSPGVAVFNFGLGLVNLAIYLKG